MKWHVVNIEGKKLREIELPESVFGCESNESVIHSVVKSYMRTEGRVLITKTRSLVSGGGKKPFRQKGTGSARQGSSRSPLMEGGAVSHGPQPRDYTQRINKKVKQKAMLIALSDKVRHNNLVVVDTFAQEEFSTKKVGQTLQNVGLTLGVGALLGDVKASEHLVRSARNLKYVSAVDVANINSEHVLRSKSLVLTEGAVEALIQRLSVGEK